MCGCYCPYRYPKGEKRCYALIIPVKKEFAKCNVSGIFGNKNQQANRLDEYNKGLWEEETFNKNPIRLDLGYGDRFTSGGITLPPGDAVLNSCSDDRYPDQDWHTNRNAGNSDEGSLFKQEPGPDLTPRRWGVNNRVGGDPGVKGWQTDGMPRKCSTAVVL